MVKENLLHFIWQNQLLEAGRLETTSGESIKIKNVGTLNYDAGPDFKNAQIQIGHELWAGHVEIHINAKDWFAHGHQNDENYDNVILHVVLFNDDDKLGLPTLELNGKIKPGLLNHYQKLMESKSWIPCADKIEQVNEFVLFQMKERLIVERLERKIEFIKSDLDNTNNNWEECFYRSLMRYAGLKVNKPAFNKLALHLPYKLISKHRDNQFQVEALFFGVGGFLAEINDTYQKRLQSEYKFLKQKYKLKELKITDWQFATLRPANFPTVRLAQMASLFSNKKLSFEKTISITKPSEYINELTKVNASEYWNKHYNFNSTSKTTRIKRIGKTFAQLLLINHYTPIIYAYGWYKQDYALKEKAIELLSSLTPESNSIIKKWAALNVKSKSAFDSQALLELKNEYCELKKCLNCSIGNTLLRKDYAKH